MAVYLLHFTGPDIRHYIGHTDRAAEVRFAEHQSGHGAIRTGKLIKAGYSVDLAHVWPTANLRLEYYLTMMCERADGYRHEDICPYCVGHSRALPTLDDVKARKRLGLCPPMPKDWGGPQRARLIPTNPAVSLTRGLQYGRQ